MCGIVGIASRDEFDISEIVQSLKRLEYRGYDSWGVATNDGFMEKNIGEIPKNAAIERKAKAAIAHTRWATHGGVTQANAHPHKDCSGDIEIVHNGIIENYLKLKAALVEKGHIFKSETDTETIVHFVEEDVKRGRSMEESLQRFIGEAEGTFAILAVRKGDDRIYAAKRDSPLVIGILDDGIMVASDIYAFSNRTNKALWVDNDEYAIVGSEGFEIYDSSGSLLNKEVKEFEWREELQDHSYEHFMIKEIHEIPAVAERLLLSLRQEQSAELRALAEAVKSSRKVVFVSAGTSYHASLLGAYFLNKAGIDTRTIIASEFKDYIFVDNKTLIIAISQSGETMDVIEALKVAKKRGASIASIVNLPYSAVQRMSKLSVQILAGQEICVAATKTFVNQVLVLLALAAELGWKVDYDKIPGELRAVFEFEDAIKKMAGSLKNKKDIYIIGRGMSYPVSREIALKLKEISYLHAEGMMGGELKHGTLALIEQGVPVIGLVDNKDIISNIKEVEARGGEITVISDCDTEFGGIKLNASSEASFALGATIVGQLLTYYTAKELGLPIDKPRNLAKSVTVK